MKKIGCPYWDKKPRCKVFKVEGKAWVNVLSNGRTFKMWHSTYLRFKQTQKVDSFTYV